MKTSQKPDNRMLRRSVLTGWALIAFASISTGLPQLVTAAETAKDHVLFVGTDLSVKEDGQFYRVVGASKDALQVEREHGLKTVRTNEGAEIRIMRGVKLSRLFAEVSNLHTESVDREAARAQFDAMKASMLLNDEAHMNADRLQGAMVRAGMLGTSVGTGIGSEITAANVAQIQKETTDAYAAALPGVEAMSASASTFFFERGARGGAPEVELSFDVSAPEPLDHVYILVVANYGSGNKIARQVSARELKRIDQHARRITVSHAASVSGLEFTKFDVGLYAEGQEVATNLSEKRMPLTADQAYQFFLIDYLTKHPGANTPPAAMLMTPRTEFRQQINSAEASRPIYATVDKSGAVVAMSTDEAGAEKLPASLASALQNVRFMPALQNGNPVEGRVKITLAQLVN